MKIMGGRNQHYIPQFLLRNFTDDAGKIAVYGLGEKPFKTTPRNVASERDFLDAAGPGTADENITNSETDISELMNELRDSDDGTHLDRAICARVAANFAWRTKNVREVLQLLVDPFLKKMEETFADRDVVRKYIWHLVKNRPEVIIENVRKELLKNGNMTKKQIEFAIDRIRDQCINHTEEIMESWQNESAPLLVSVLRVLHDDIENRVRQAHIRVIMDNESPTHHENRLKKYKWILVHSDKELLLPDCVLIQWTKLFGWLPYIAIIDTPKVVAMPISRRKWLLGIEEGSELPSMEALPEIADLVGCSSKFYVASEFTDELAGYISMIGWNLKTNNENLDRMMNEIIAENISS